MQPSFTFIVGLVCLIHFVYSTDPCNIKCDQQTPCTSAKVGGSATNCTEFNVSCTASNSCYNTTVVCPSNSVCNLYCSSDSCSSVSASGSQTTFTLLVQNGLLNESQFIFDEISVTSDDSILSYSTFQSTNLTLASSGIWRFGGRVYPFFRNPITSADGTNRIMVNISYPMNLTKTANVFTLSASSKYKMRVPATDTFANQFINIEGNNAFVDITSDGEFSNNTINAKNSGEVNLFNFIGLMNNNSINTDNVNEMRLYCYGGCKRTQLPNKYKLANVHKLTLHAQNDVISPEHMRLVQLTNINAYHFDAESAGYHEKVGEIRDFYIHDPQSAYVEFFLLGAKMENMSVSLPMAQNAEIMNTEDGSFRNLVVRVPKARVSIINAGLFADSVIDARNGYYFSAYFQSQILRRAPEVSATNLTLYLPLNAINNVIKCKDYGCRQLNIYTSKGADDFKVTPSECPCEEDVKNSCIEQWNIYCGTNSVPSVLMDNTCRGECCGNIVKNMQIKECYSNGNSDDDEGMSVGLTVGLIVGGVFLGTIIGSVLLYMWLMRPSKTAAEDKFLRVNDV